MCPYSEKLTGILSSAQLICRRGTTMRMVPHILKSLRVSLHRPKRLGISWMRYAHTNCQLSWHQMMQLTSPEYMLLLLCRLSAQSGRNLQTLAIKWSHRRQKVHREFGHGTRLQASFLWFLLFAQSFLWRKLRQGFCASMLHMAVLGRLVFHSPMFAETYQPACLDLKAVLTAGDSSRCSPDKKQRGPQSF